MRTAGRAYGAGMDDGVPSALAASRFAALSGPAIRRVLARARVVEFPVGAMLHWEGDDAEHLELVVDGLVRAFVTAPDGRTLTIRYCRRGALIGAVSMYASWFRMPVGIQAVVPSRLLLLSPDVVRRAALHEPPVMEALLRELADRTLAYIHEITGSAFSTVRERVARHLLDLAAQDVSGPGSTQSTLQVVVSQRQLAESAGTVREVVVRALRELRQSGAIRTHPDHIDIVDPILLSQEGGTGVPDITAR
jgi:CRP/FNR family transcriptional regulator, cyclic AMP receptor protein